MHSHPDFPHGQMHGMQSWHASCMYRFIALQHLRHSPITDLRIRRRRAPTPSQTLDVAVCNRPCCWVPPGQIGLAVHNRSKTLPCKAQLACRKRLPCACARGKHGGALAHCQPCAASVGGTAQPRVWRKVGHDNTLKTQTSQALAVGRAKQCMHQSGGSVPTQAGGRHAAAQRQHRCPKPRAWQVACISAFHTMEAIASSCYNPQTVHKAGNA